MALLGEQLVMSVCKIETGKVSPPARLPSDCSYQSYWASITFSCISRLHHQQGDEALGDIFLCLGPGTITRVPFGSAHSCMTDNACSFYVCVCVCVGAWMREGGEGAPCNRHNWWLSKLIWRSKYQCLSVCALFVQRSQRQSQVLCSIRHRCLRNDFSPPSLCQFVLFAPFSLEILLACFFFVVVWNHIDSLTFCFSVQWCHFSFDTWMSNFIGKIF